jgi:hypothetical protein
MTHVQANFAGATPLEGPLVSGLVATGTLPDRLKAFAGQHWVQTLAKKDTAQTSLAARAEQGSDVVDDNPASAGAANHQPSDVAASDRHLVTARENAVRVLTEHAGPYPWQPVLALALGIAFASLAIGVAADLGAGAAARPHYVAVDALPT